MQNFLVLYPSLIFGSTRKKWHVTQCNFCNYINTAVVFEKSVSRHILRVKLSKSCSFQPVILISWNLAPLKLKIKIMIFWSNRPLLDFKHQHRCSESHYTHEFTNRLPRPFFPTAPSGQPRLLMFLNGQTATHHFTVFKFSFFSQQNFWWSSLPSALRNSRTQL